MTRVVGLAVMIVCPCATALSGGIGTWKNYTSMKEVRGLTFLHDAVWAATSGGLFRWSPARGDFTALTTADGLGTVDLTAIAVDRGGSLWTGSSTGILHQYLPAEGTLRTMTDIARTGQAAKRIRAIVPAGDSLLIATDFGLSIYRLAKSEFGDTFTRFGRSSTGTATSVLSAAIFGGRIWAAISDGQTINRVAVASLSAPNLLPPESWELQIVGDPGTVISSLVVFQRRLYAGTSSGIYVTDGSVWTRLQASGARAILALATSPSVLLAVSSFLDVIRVDTSGAFTPIGPGLPSAPTSVSLDGTGNPLVGTVDAGIVTLTGQQWTSHFPNGPNASRFLSVAVEQDGTVWGGSGLSSGQGVYRLSGTTWKSFTRSTSALPADEVWRVSVTSCGSVWASTYGRGVAEILHGSDTIEASRVYGLNVGMVGIPNDPTYVVVSNVVCDSRGNTWMSIISPVDRNVFAVRTPDGRWAHLPAIRLGSKLSTLHESLVDRCLAVDAFDNIWATVRDPGFKGVISLANRGAVDSLARVHLTSANGLPGDDVRTIVVDRENDIWVGTDKGIGIILDPENPLRSDGNGIARYKPLNGLTINTIAVDPLNQKWVGTTEGVVLLSPDGTQVLAAYTVETTGGKLIDNDVKSIAVDPASGTVYFGTTTGLASLSTPAAAPRARFDGLEVYPNPFKIPSPIPLSIDGLVANSSLKVLSIDGTLIRDVRTPGGRVGYWDGKDTRGKDVPSGVYIIVGYAEDGGAVASGKVAVVRR